MRLGVTGHQRLAYPADWLWVQTELENCLSKMPVPLVGFTSLAIGADQLFAETVLKHGGSLTVIIPFLGYELKFADGQAQETYQRLLARATEVEVLKGPASNREAYFRAGKQILHRSELLIAVWDGRPAAGLGGTGDVVQYARQSGTRIHLIDPAGRTTKELENV